MLLTIWGWMPGVGAVGLLPPAAPDAPQPRIVFATAWAASIRRSISRSLL